MTDPSQRYDLTHEFNHVLQNSYGTILGTNVAWIQESHNDYLILLTAEYANGATPGQSAQFTLPSNVGYLDALVYEQPFVSIESCGIDGSDTTINGPEDYMTDTTGYRYNDLFPLFVAQRVGPHFFAAVWEQARTTEQVLQTMTRLLDATRVQCMVGEYAARLALGDFNELSASIQTIASGATAPGMYAATSNQNGWLVPSETATLPRYTGRNNIPVAVSSGATQVSVDFSPNAVGSNGTPAAMQAQIAYRATDGTAVFSRPVTSGSTSVTLTKAPKNGVVVVVITNITMSGYTNAQSYGWIRTRHSDTRFRSRAGLPRLRTSPISEWRPVRPLPTGHREEFFIHGTVIRDACQLCAWALMAGRIRTSHAIVERGCLYALEHRVRCANRNEWRNLLAAADRRRVHDQLRPQRHQRAGAEYVGLRVGRRTDVHLSRWHRERGRRRSPTTRRMCVRCNTVEIRSRSPTKTPATPTASRTSIVETYSLVNTPVWSIPSPIRATRASSSETSVCRSPSMSTSGSDVIYEQRAVYHSFVGNNSSYITVSRPSGVGPLLLLVPDPTTGAGFEYMDAWSRRTIQAARGPRVVARRRGPTVWMSFISTRVSSRAPIAGTCRAQASHWRQGRAKRTRSSSSTCHGDDVKSQLYSEGLVDVTAVPGMMFPTNATAMIDLHTSKTINSVTAQYPCKRRSSLWDKGARGTVTTSTKSLSLLGPNNVSVSYGNRETTTVQLYALEPLDHAIQRHASFMINSMQTPSGDMKGLFDDWLMDTQSRRGATGGWGWGDDWGWTQGRVSCREEFADTVRRGSDRARQLLGRDLGPFDQ